MESRLELILLLVHGATAWAMLGLIWWVQLVHYPLFSRVAPDHFQMYQAEHMRRAGWVVAPLMSLEAASGGGLAVRGFLQREPLFGFAAALLVLAWAATFAIQVPAHRKLLRGLDLRVLRRLVQSNWIRTIAWTVRGLILLWLVAARI